MQYNRMWVYKRATVAVVYDQNQSTYMNGLETDREINTRFPFLLIWITFNPIMDE